MNFRNLKPEEIQVRINNCTEKGATFLLYKDARCDMDILDETVGCDNWQRKHYENKGNLYCSVGIKCGDEWVWKDDCGAESNTEKEKGESSDSFKRACVNWGIGRELYTKIFIFIQIATVEKGKKPNGAPKYEPKNPFEKFIVSHIEYEGKKITALEISDTNGVVAFKWGAKTTEPKKTEPKDERSMMFFCKDCGKVLKPYTDANGKNVAIRAIAAQTEKQFGRVLCTECALKAAGK